MSLRESISVDHHLSWWERHSPVIISMLVGFILLGLNFYIESVERESAKQEELTRVSTLAGTVRAQLEGELNGAIHLSLGLGSYISANPDFTQNDFERIAHSLLQYGRHIRNIVVAPDNVVRYVYPLAGNEKVMGLRYMDNAEQRNAILHMMETREFVLAGPVNLVQGGTGFINRLPIFLPAKGPDKTPTYWGVASIVLNVDSLLTAGGVIGSQAEIRYALRGKDGKGAKGDMIYGEPALFLHNPVLFDVVMPGDSRWQLAAIPQKGWGASPMLPKSQVFFMVGLFISALLSMLTYVWLRQIRKIRLHDATLRLAASVFESANEGILITDRHHIVEAVNPAVTKITGYKPEDILNQPIKFMSESRISPEQRAEMIEKVEKEGAWQGEVWGMRKDGTVFPKALTVTGVYDNAGKAVHFINSFSDISERKLAEERIYSLAHNDGLTGLPNRMDLYGRLQQAMATAARHHGIMAVMILDMDNFKIINDTLGHHVGDGLLMEIANRLKASVRGSDIVARLGGDEFVVVLTETDSLHTTANVAEKILHNLGCAYLVDGYELHSTPSIGIGIFPHDGDSAEALMKNVDTAMYHAKSMGRNNYQFFTEAMRLAVGERLRMENSLRQAIIKKEFVLHYQPQVDIVSGRVSGVEALVRWRHPELGLISPLKFISVAEESDLIIPLGEWVLKEACRQAKLWQKAGIDLRMSVNLSARQLRSKNLLGLVERLIKKYEIEPGSLELEITESIAMDNPEKTIELLTKLRSKGVALAIDDFGTGYSSLSYLRMLPINRLKIDQSFVKDIESDPNDAAICAATIALAHILGLSLVAEGVETQAQMEYLREQGCDTAQGYLFSKPIPPGELLQFLSRRTERAVNIAQA